MRYPINSFLRGWLLLTVLLSAPGYTYADRLSSLPDNWHKRLSAVALIDVSGTDRFMQHEIKQARAAVDHLLGMKTPEPEKLADAWGKLGALYQLRDIDTAARQCYLNARTLQPGTMRWHYYLAWLALDTGDAEQALVHLDEVNRLQPDLPSLRLRRAQARLSLNQLDLASEDFTDAQQHPGLTDAANAGLAQIALLQRRYQDAGALFTRVLAAQPEATQLHYPLAQALRGSGDMAAAKRHLHQRGNGRVKVDDKLVNALEQLDAGPSRYFEQAMAAVRKKDYATALSLFADGLAFEAENTHARTSYARALYLDGQQSAAERELRRVIAEDKEHVLATFLLGLLAIAADDQVQAMASWRAVLALDPQHDGAHFHLAKLLFKQQQFQQAASHFTEAARINPDNQPARFLAVISRHHAGAQASHIRQQLQQMEQQSAGNPLPAYALIRLLLFGSDGQSVAIALQRADELVARLPFPPFMEVQALALAANARYEDAARLQQQLIAMAQSKTSAEFVATLQQTLQAFEQQQVPEQSVFPLQDPLLIPPPIQPQASFRDYPAANPY